MLQLAIIYFCLLGIYSPLFSMAIEEATFVHSIICNNLGAIKHKYDELQERFDRTIENYDQTYNVKIATKRPEPTLKEESLYGEAYLVESDFSFYKEQVDTFLQLTKKKLLLILNNYSLDKDHAFLKTALEILHTNFTEKITSLNNNLKALLYHIEQFTRRGITQEVGIRFNLFISIYAQEYARHLIAILKLHHTLHTYLNQFIEQPYVYQMDLLSFLGKNEIQRIPTVEKTFWQRYKSIIKGITAFLIISAIIVSYLYYKKRILKSPTK